MTLLVANILIVADEQATTNLKFFTATNNSVAVHIRYLREKVHGNAEHPQYIKTVWEGGYKIEK